MMWVGLPVLVIVIVVFQELIDLLLEWVEGYYQMKISWVWIVRIVRIVRRIFWNQK